MCLNPIWSIIYPNDDGKNVVRIFSSKDFADAKLVEYKKYISIDADVIPLPCGKCEQCSKQRAIEWSYRLFHESQFFDKSCFITLTYKDDPKFVEKRDLQLFIKRLRKFIYPQKIKFFACGEYGSLRGRPHYHLVVFGWSPDDLKFLMMDKNHFKIFNSLKLSQIWNKGYVSVGECSMASYKYVCNYMQKQNKYKWHVDELFDEHPPFVLMSKGIGKRWFLEHKNSIISDKVFYGSNSYKIPRYYLKICENENLLCNHLHDLKIRRKIKAKLNSFSKSGFVLGGIYEKCE